MAHIVNLRHAPALRAALDRKLEHGGTVRIDRRSQWGNRFRIGPDGPRDEVIARYRADLWRRIRAAALPWAGPRPRRGMGGLRSGGTEGRVKRERGERREEGERGPRASAARKENRNAIRYLQEYRPVRVEGPPRWRSRRQGCGATRRYASVAVTGHAVQYAGDPFGPGSPLQSPLAGPAPETRVSIPEPPRASVPIANKHYSSRRDGPLSHTCSLRQPLRGPTLRSAPFRPWLARLRR